jgi:lipooligosaccharide transport system ATP-binding protein
VRALRDAGTSVLLTTHYMDEAERLCDRVAILSEGRRVCEGRPQELIEQRLAREAVEIDCSPEEERRLLDGTHWPHLRSGRRLIVYTDEPARVVSRAQARTGGAHGSLAVRPTNLEDVFLAETGNRLEEQS